MGRKDPGRKDAAGPHRAVGAPGGEAGAASDAVPPKNAYLDSLAAPSSFDRTLRPKRLADFVGLGRVVLSYPDLPADVLGGRPLRRAAICRTFSDCTTGPRLGMVSGCYPLDAFYESRPEAERIRKVRVDSRTASPAH